MDSSEEAVKEEARVEDAYGLWLEEDREVAAWEDGGERILFLNAERCVSSVGLVGVRGLRLVPLCWR